MATEHRNGMAFIAGLASPGPTYVLPSNSHVVETTEGVDDRGQQQQLQQPEELHGRRGRRE